MFRTYPLPHYANHRKISVLKETLKYYRKMCDAIASHQWYLLWTEGRFNKMSKGVKGIESPLSERYKQTAQTQVVGGLNSYLSLCKQKYNKIVYRLKVDNETKKELYKLNRSNQWHKHPLARKIFKRVLSKNKKPSFKKANMVLNANQVDIQDSKETTFPYWAKISTIEKGKPIYIPLRDYPYFREREGTIVNMIQVNETNGSLSFSLVKEHTQEDYTPETDSIALDFGLDVVFTSDKGDLFGQSLYPELQKLDEQITNLGRNRQKQGLKPSSKRRKTLVRRAKEKIKNEINRCLNRVISLYKPKELIVESLNFQGSKLSKKLNRMLQNCGRSVIRQKLQSLEETFGILVTQINPAYTSQECSSCHNVDKANRVTRSQFSCTSCGLNMHADINAARNILRRRSIPGLDQIYITKHYILERLRKLHLERFQGRSSPACTLMDPLPW